MNIEAGVAFGNLIQRIPLRKAPNIIHGNALRTDWNEILPSDNCSYVFGNPPFIGKKERSPDQKADHQIVWDGRPRTALLDYVTCWYKKTAEYVDNENTQCAFVSTNSITQGEQVSVFWQNVSAAEDLYIQFAHRTFAWRSDAVRPASVHVVIIGFGKKAANQPKLFDYDTVDSEPQETTVKNISPYLVEGDRFVFAVNRTNPILESTPSVCYGSFALDDGGLTLSSDDRQAIINEAPDLDAHIRLFLGSRELIHGVKRYCLWLDGVTSGVLKQSRIVKDRIEKVKEWRSGRDRATTVELAKTPTIFAEIRQPNQRYLAFPTASLESRHYIPIAFLEKSVIASNQLYIVKDAEDWHFGILTSAMHMAWVDSIAGRIKSDYRYSARLVYNNFPWPVSTDEKIKLGISKLSKNILTIRDKYKKHTLAELYDPLAMPKDLYDAHRKLDKQVDKYFGYKGPSTSAARASFLLDAYESQTSL